MAIAQQFESILGASNVVPLSDLAADWQQRVAATFDTLPECVVYPQTPEELAEVVACADKHEWRCVPCGNGS
ncbi:FAD-binding oxidoreductase, partial [bacterium]|nr:FAD-binding oxidoreductase [bacterium]